MSTPLLSVIVPNYNYARFLPSRMESILKQTFTDYEIILLDDASTDNSQEVLKSYENNKHVSHVIFNKINTGSPFKQWMKGILLAKGKYIWVAEADDLAEPDFLATCVNEMQTHPNSAICFSGSVEIDEDGKCRHRDINHWKRGSKGSACHNGKKYVEYNLYWKNYIMNASGVVFRRNYALKLTKSNFLNMRSCGDWLFWAQMAWEGDVIEVYRNLNYFRQHNAKVTTKTRKTGKNFYEQFAILAFIEQLLPQMSAYKKSFRHGKLYRSIKRAPITPEQRAILLAEAKRVLGVTHKDYITERCNQLLRILIPRLPTSSRERL